MDHHRAERHREVHAADAEAGPAKVRGQQVQQKYEAWKRIAQELGPRGLLAIRGFRDEALSGDWKGFRSSRLNDGYRVIYSVHAAVFTVSVERISKHDYR